MRISVANRQRAVRLNLRWLRDFAICCLPKCETCSGDGGFSLKQLPEIEVAIVSDRVIGRVHEQFMNIPGPTDVLTFDHGEIVISAQTALSYAKEYGHSVEKEVALYTVHGLLHLNGFEDATPRQAQRMKRVQDRIWKECISQVPNH